jgi:hypothetical protein
LTVLYQNVMHVPYHDALALHSHTMDYWTLARNTITAAVEYMAVLGESCIAEPASCLYDVYLCGLQVHLTYWSSSSVLVSWASCDAQLKQLQSVATDSIRSVVHYGTSKDSLHHTAEGVATSYVNEYTGNGTSYASPVLHHVLLKGALVCLGVGAIIWLRPPHFRPQWQAASAAVVAVAVGCGAAQAVML